MNRNYLGRSNVSPYKNLPKLAEYLEDKYDEYVNMPASPKALHEWKVMMPKRVMTKMYKKNRD